MMNKKVLDTQVTKYIFIYDGEGDKYCDGVVQCSSVQWCSSQWCSFQCCSLLWYLVQ